MALDRATRIRLRTLRLLSLAPAFAVLLPQAARAVDLTTKTPNIESPRTTPPGELHFPFTHRFALAGTKVTNTPTLTLSTGLAPATSVSFRWASNSSLAPRDSASAFHQVIDPVNEFEVAIAQGLLAQGSGAPLDLTGIVAYNTAANSGDAAVVLGHRIGPLTLLATAKGFSSGFGVGGYTAAASGGVLWRLTRFLNVSADLGGVLWAQRDSLIFATSNTPAVSLGLGFEIPYSPHSMLLYVTNVDTHTLQGTSRGAPPSLGPATGSGVLGAILDRLKFGFEFHVPFGNWTRWMHIVAPPTETPPAPAEGPGDAAPGASSPAPAPGAPSPSAPASAMLPDGGRPHSPGGAIGGPTATVPASPDLPAPEAVAPGNAPPGSAPPEGPPGGQGAIARPAPPGGTGMTTGRVPPSASGEAATQAPLAEQTVVIEGFKFNPDTITVPAGTTVRWINRDAMIHTVTASDKKSFDSGDIAPGKSWSRKFDRPGTHAYFCTPHPFMTGKVVVK